MVNGDEGGGVGCCYWFRSFTKWIDHMGIFAVSTNLFINEKSRIKSPGTAIVTQTVKFEPVTNPPYGVNF